MSADRSENRQFWLFLLCLVPLYLTWTFDHSLWNPDETRDGGIASEMFRNGDYVVPRLNGQPFLEKPPLYYWTASLVYKVTGHVTAGTTRFPSVFYGLLGIIFTFLIGKLRFNQRVGLLAACLLALSAQYFRMSHLALMDIALASLVTGAMYFYLKESIVGFVLFTILAFYAKGLLGLILSGLVVSLDCLLDRNFRRWGRHLAAGMLLSILLIGPWLWGLWKTGGVQFLKVFFIDNHWKRFFSDAADHTEHFWFFYFFSFPADFMPATLVFAGFLWDLVKQPVKYIQSPSRKFLLLWFFGLLGFFCLSSSKRSIYLLPLMPAAALLSACWLDDVLSTRMNGKVWERRILAGMGGFAAVVGLSSFIAAPRLDKGKSFVPFCEVVQSHRGNAELIGYDMSEMERGVFGFYLKGPFENLLGAKDLRAVLDKKRDQSFFLIANRNKKEEIAPVIGDKMRLVHEFRPDKRTRSYLLYENTHR